MNKRQFLNTAVAACLVIQTPSSAGAAALAPEQFAISQDEIKKVPSRYRRKIVAYHGGERPGTIVVDTASRYLYLIQPGGKAIRYGIGVGRQGFSWSGGAIIRRKAKWPRWTPPAEMVARDSYAAKWKDGMPGGPTNPLGARALYLFQGDVDTLYRIHGTYQAESIGKAVSSGCIRLLNADVADLYERVGIGTPVIVRQDGRGDAVATSEEQPANTKPAPVVRRNFNLTREYQDSR